MELRITTILPTDDAGLARQLFNNLIKEQAVVLGVVVGNDGWCNELIQKADKVAFARQSIRRSVWIRDVKPVADILSGLSGKNLPQIQPYFFSLSMGDKVCDILLSEGAGPDFGRIDEAFRTAEIG